jgi:hypothetical protein
LLTIGAGVLMAQHGPVLVSLTAAAAGPPHQQDPRPRSLRGGEHEFLGLRLQVKALEAVGRPSARILDEYPDNAV